MKTTPKETLQSKRADRIPGSTLRELTAPAIDDQGRHWGAGTQFQPGSIGTDNRTGRLCCRVTILDHGQRIEATFVAAAATAPRGDGPRTS